MIPKVCKGRHKFCCLEKAVSDILEKAAIENKRRDAALEDGCRANDVQTKAAAGNGKIETVEAVFQVRNVSKIYRMGEVEVRALSDVNLDLYEGELAVLLGASGSGKSTLLNIIGGLDTPTSGTVAFRDHVLTEATDAELTEYRRDHVGFVFQFYNLIPSLTALENVQLITEIAARPLPADEALGLVGLKERLNHFPAQLSGGEQQRVAIARAIAKQPDVLLCDEPTGALDYKTGKIVLEVIERVNRELGTTTAVITHNASIARMADRVIHIGSGRIVSIEKNEVKAKPDDLSW